MRSLCSLLLCSLAACATIPHSRAIDGASWKLTASEPDPADDALAETFYGGSFEVTAFTADIDAAIARNPRSGVLHEIRGQLALLAADTDRAWHELLLAAFDTRNQFAVDDLWMSHQGDLTLGERLSDLDALELLERAHPDAVVRAHAAMHRATTLRLLGRLDEARADVAKLHALSAWKIIGAFDNEEGRGFNAALPPESKIDLNAALPGAVVPIRWRSVEALDRAGAVPLGSLVSPSQEAVAYLLTWVKSAKETDASLRMTTPAPIVAWLNDVEVSREERLRHGSLDNVVVRIHLRAGWNKLLFKSAEKKGAWSFSARLTDESGEPLPLEANSAEPQQLGAPTNRSAAKIVDATAEGSTASARDRVLQMRDLAHRGFVHEAAERLSAAASAKPTNVLLRLFAANVLRDDAQLEHALDLLSTALDGAAHPAPELLLRRASIYREKGLNDQAESDLRRAAELNGSSRAVQLELAGLLGARGWQQERRAQLTATIERWPDSINARVDLARCLEAQGYEREATQLDGEILQVEPGNETVLLEMRNRFERRLALHQALSETEWLLTLESTNVQHALDKANLQRKMGDAASSDATLLAVSRQDPDLATPYRQRAVLAEEAGQQARALPLWEQAAERNPNDSFIAERLDHLKPHEPDLARKYVPTDAEIEAAIQRAKTVERMPGAQLAHLLDTETVQLNSDGSSKRYVVSVATAFTQTGRDELIQRALPRHGKNKVLAAYAVQPDGHRQEASSITTTGVRFRKLELGATVVLRYIEYALRQERLQGEYFAQVPLTSFSGQTERASYTLLYSHDRNVSFETSSGVTREDSMDGDWNVRRFFVSHAPPEVVEPSMTPSPYEHFKWVAASTLPDWEKFVAWERAILLDSFRPDPEIHALALKLTDGVTAPQEKLDRLYRFVAQEIRYQQEYESILAGWQPHAATVVLERKYGDCKDKATLLISLAREVGIEGQFVVLATHSLGRPFKSVVIPHSNHAIAYFPEQTGIGSQFIDTTVDALDIGNLRHDDQGALGLVLNPATGAFRWQEIPYQAPELQRDEHAIEIEIDSLKTARAADIESLRGSMASGLRQMMRNEVLSQKFYSAAMSQYFPRSTLLHAGPIGEPEELAHPLQLKFEADISNSINAEADHARLKLPALFSLARMVSLSERKTTLDLGIPSVLSMSLTARLGAGLRLKTPPAQAEVKSRCFVATREVKVDGNLLHVRDRVERTCTEITPTDYAGFRADVERAAGQLDDAIVFEAAPGADESSKSAPARKGVSGRKAKN